ncbi:winged helix-turn-helix domain-containing protein [uncultured Methanomethylovorans sp.]|uniref:winged helix-turn-helix domain-containing protein n=1 Tax=uncultured Methanomethylovorans sp. TaxID=183759 RepID=UPI002AA6991C|nr:winged helix-turn-helix domain-containing protein [uncultured Methanomethylovorans sp.]
MDKIHNSSLQCKELEELKKEISLMRSEFNGFLESSGRYLVEQTTSQLRGSFSKALIDYIKKDTSDSLEKHMVHDCRMYEGCKQKFEELLSETSYLLSQESVSKELVDQYWQKIDQLRQITGQLMCSQCFSEVSRLYDSQIEAMRSLQIYERQKGDHKLEEIPLEVVDSICEPVSNKQRLLILKALAGSPRGFSELSKITYLRGGNLLFHLQKLLDSKMILQHNERGDYQITRKGYVTMEGLLSIYSNVKDSYYILPTAL